MRKHIKWVALLTVLVMLLSGCNSKGEIPTDNSSTSADTSFAVSEAEMFTDRDKRISYDESTAIFITLNGDSVACSSDKVQIEGSTVTITDEGTYILSGTLNDGMIIVDAQDTDKPQLVFNGVSITSLDSAPLYVKEADKVFITLAENSQNMLSNGGTFTAIDENNIDGAIFSKQDLTFNGNGIMEISSPAGHGIVCKDDLVFTSGMYNITANAHGLDANDSVRIVNSSLSITAGKDGIHAENSDDASLGFVYVSSGTFTVSALDDGISSGAYMQIENGTFSIQAGMQSSTDNTSLKGLKATASMLINGGSFEITASDDTVHSNESIIVNGGAFEISSSDDGFHADETLKISDGTINITKSYEGLEALNIEILGGDIKVIASDDGLNAAGGNDSSGFGGMGGMHGGHGGGMRPGEQFGGGPASSSGLITISGGTLYIQASGDGIDANGDLSITGGNISVCGPTSGDTAVLDYDGTGTISGGTFCGSGAYMMAQSLTGSGQGVLGVSVGNQSAGTTVVVKDSNGNTVISYTPALSFQIVIISSPDIIKGEAYTLVIGSTSGTVTAQ